MTAYHFIFSNRPIPRFARHLGFWLFYFFYTFLISIPGISWKILSDPGLYQGVFSEGIYYLPVYFFSVYTTLYFIYPKFIASRNFWFLVPTIAIMMFVSFELSDFITRHFFITDKTADNQDIFTVSIIKGLGEQVLITGTAVSIKAMKDYYLRDEEYKKLLVLRIYHQLDMMKMKMEPALLLGVLKNIHDDIDRKGHAAPDMILKLSDLLSYILYESDARHVPLKKEITMLHDYCNLKELIFHRQLDTKVEITGEPDHQTITPLILLPFLELSFPREQEEEYEYFCPAINIHINGHEFHFNVETNLPYPADGAASKNPVLENALQNLRINYPERHSIRFEETELGFGIHLTLNLNYHPGTIHHETHPAI